MIRLYAAALLAMVPVAAEADQTDPATPEQDVDCAIWASMMAGNTTDKDALLGIGSTMGYFIGRYEAASANDIDEVMMVRTPQIAATDVTSLNAICQARMLRFGQRLVVLGERLQVLGRELEQE